MFDLPNFVLGRPLFTPSTLESALLEAPRSAFSLQAPSRALHSKHARALFTERHPKALFHCKHRGVLLTASTLGCSSLQAPHCAFH